MIRCACGAAYDATSWRRLHYVGVQSSGVDRIELRNCGRCDSTIACPMEDAPSTCSCCGHPIAAAKVWAHGYGVLHDCCAEQVLPIGRRGAYLYRPIDRRPAILSRGSDAT